MNYAVDLNLQRAVDLFSTIFLKFIFLNATVFV